VLVVDEGFIGSLHAALGLHAAGCTIQLVGAVGGQSTYSGDTFSALTCPPPTQPDFVPAVRAFARNFNADVVYAATEPSHTCLYPEVPLPDKLEAAEIAAAAGLHVPAHSCTPPVVVKSTVGRGADAVVVADSDAAVRAAVVRIESANRTAFVQEFIAGSTYLFGGLFVRGEPLRIYAGRKLRQHPRVVGPATVMRSEHDEELIEAGMRFFRHFGWTGLASADFIRARDGTLYFLEVNPRPWGSIAAARDAGVDLFTPLARLLAGSVPNSDLTFRDGVVTRVFPLYLLAANPLLWLRLPQDVRRDGFWFDLNLTRHVLYRLRRVRANWPTIVPRT
jgi:hypothetical protein